MRAAWSALFSYVRTRWHKRFANRAALEAWQDRQVRAMLRRVRRRSRFYRALYQGLNNADWRNFPVIDKQQMMQNFDQLNTRGIAQADAMALALRAEESRDFTPMLRGITVGLSSGTSGQRGLFLASHGERGRWVGAVLAKALPRPNWRRHRVALFLRANSNLYAQPQGRWLRFRFFDLLQPVAEHLEALQAYQPTVLLGPPSMLRMLAEAQRRGAIAIKPVKVIAVAEVLDPLDEAVIRAAFGQIVHQYYQCTEGFLGVTCAYGTLHLNEDMAVIQREPVPGDALRFVPIVTDFRRSTQPIIRYRLDDVLVLRSHPCPCGSLHTAVARVEGRCDDVFHWPHADSGAPVAVFPDYISRAVMGASPGVLDYCVVQSAPGALTVSLLLAPDVPAESLQAAVQAALYKLATRLQCRAPSVQFAPYEPPAPGAKLRRVRANRQAA